MRYASVAVYASLALIWIYGVLNTSRSDDSRPPGFWDSTQAAIVFASVLLATGVLVGRWWGPLLALVPALLAVPAGYEPDGYPEVPIWFYLAVQGVMFGAPILAAGVVARQLFQTASRGWRGSRRAPGTGPPAASRR